jgi:hypothetical protein
MNLWVKSHFDSQRNKMRSSGYAAATAAAAVVVSSAAFSFAPQAFHARTAQRSGELILQYCSS